MKVRQPKKNKVSYVKFPTMENYIDSCEQKDLTLILPMYNYISENFKTRKKEHTVLKIEIENTKEVFKIILTKDKFKDTLKHILDFFLAKENYEICGKINKLLNNE